MIFDFILNVVAFLLTSLSRILPTITIFPADLAPDIAQFMIYVFGWSWLFPVSTLLYLFSIIVLLVFAEFIFFTTMYIFGIIHASVK